MLALWCKFTILEKHTTVMAIALKYTHARRCICEAASNILTRILALRTYIIYCAQLILTN
jgi:hypothetical protein